MPSAPPSTSPLPARVRAQPATLPRLVVFSVVLLTVACARGQSLGKLFGKHTGNAAAKQEPVPVLMLSDIHFEPFRDPAKLPQLRVAPIEQWPAILSAPASPSAAEDFAALAKSCPVHGLDTAWPLFSTSLAQAAAQQHQPLFVTVSGDLLSHEFACRYKTLTPNSTDSDASAFAAKTIAFVAAQLRGAFPKSPVYLALGNNDTGCRDYREDRNSAFLQQTGRSFAAAAATGDNTQVILHDFSDEGDYNIALPDPMHGARLIVLQDIFESEHYEPCAGKGKAADDTAQAAQLAWLQSQLQQARARHQRVWVMAHVPPGVDMYSTVTQKRNVCGGQAPAMYLRSEKLADVLTANADVIALTIFAHSHADELRFLHGSNAAATTPGIAVKLVSSISAVNGNHPTFTLAQVDPQTTELLDYTVFLTGDGASATREYSFRETYKLPSFSPDALESLTAGFLADPASGSAASQAYQRLYFPGDNGFHAAAMQLLWHTYACSLRENKPDAFRACVCPADPAK